MKSFILAIIISTALSEEREISTLAGFLLLGVVIGALDILSHLALGTSSINTGMERATSLSGDPNDTARLLILGVPLAIFWMFHANSRFVRTMNMVAFLCIFAGVMLTKSRSGFLTLVVVLGILYFRHLSLKTTVGAVILLIACIIFGYAVGYWDRIETLSTLQEKNISRRDNSLKGRLNLLSKGSLLFYRNFIIGVGPGRFGSEYVEVGREGSKIRSNISYPPAAHNLFLEFAVENGALGLTLLCFILYSSLRGLFRFSRGDPENPYVQIGFYLGTSLVGLLVAGLFLSGGEYKQLWLLVGIGLAADQLKKSSTSAIPSSASKTEVPLTCK